MASFLWLPALALTGLWWLLTAGAADAWLIGIPAIAAAVWAIGRLGGGGAGSLSPAGMLRFIPFFVWASIRGGLDVAARVLTPRLRVKPGFASYAIRLQRPDARLLFANCVSLLPGTLATDLRDQQLDIHALDVSGDFASELRRVEAAVARVFGESL